MKTIKFRGKRVDNGGCIIGNLINLKSGVFILEEDANLDSRPEFSQQGMGCGIEDRNITDRYEAAEYGWDKCIQRFEECLLCYVEVHPESVGQFTGLTDKSGKEIYDGDILDGNRVVTFKYGAFWNDEIFGKGKFPICFHLSEKLDHKIIGNIHDNPELLTA